MPRAQCKRRRQTSAPVDPLIVSKNLRPALATIAGLLISTERKAVVISITVDVNRSDGQFSRHTLRSFTRSRLHKAGKPIGGIIGHGDCFILRIEWHHRQNRSVDLFAHKSAFRALHSRIVSASQSSPFRTRPAYLGHQREGRPLINFSINESLHPIELNLAKQQPPVIIFFIRIRYAGSPKRPWLGVGLSDRKSISQPTCVLAHRTIAS